MRRDKSDVLEAEPRLLRFLGRPDDTSPKAMAKMVFGHPLPFDRHDWIVDRGGKEVHNYTWINPLPAQSWEGTIDRHRIVPVNTQDCIVHWT